MFEFSWVNTLKWYIVARDSEQGALLGGRPGLGWYENQGQQCHDGERGFAANSSDF